MKEEVAEEVLEEQLEDRMVQVYTEMAERKVREVQEEMEQRRHHDNLLPRERREIGKVVFFFSSSLSTSFSSPPPLPRCKTPDCPPGPGSTGCSTPSRPEGRGSSASWPASWLDHCTRSDFQTDWLQNVFVFFKTFKVCTLLHFTVH